MKFIQNVSLVVCIEKSGIFCGCESHFYATVSRFQFGKSMQVSRADSSSSFVKNSIRYDKNGEQSMYAL